MPPNYTLKNELNGKKKINKLIRKIKESICNQYVVSITQYQWDSH